MTDCDLQDADMQEAILLRTNLRGANLNGVDFTSACLTEADLTGADIRGADFSGAMLEGTILVATQRNRATKFADTDIAEVNCDTDLSRETLTGTSTAESMTLRYAKFSDHVAFFAVVWMAAVVGGLLGIVAGSVADRFLGKPTLGSYPAIFGAALGAFLGFRALVRRRSTD